MKLILSRNLKVVLALTVLALALAAPAAAQVTYLVTVDTSSVNGTTGFLDFQFNPANNLSQLASAQIVNFTAGAGAVTGVPSTTGNVAGALAAPVTFQNTTALNEYFQGITFGNQITFQLVLSGPAITAPNGGPFGTSFFLSFFDAAQNTILTNDPTGVAGEVDIPGNGVPVTIANPNAVGGPSVVTFSLLGTIQVCKVAGAGVIAGTNFNFNVGAIPVIVAAGPAPNGTCAPPVQVTANINVLIAEALPPSTLVTDIHASPGVALLAANLAAGMANVTANGLVPTVVTFTDSANGSVTICKVAGAGVAVGTPVNFNVGGNIITVNAGPAPTGTCGVPVSVPPGGVSISEQIPGGEAVSSISATGGSLNNINLASGSAGLLVAGGNQAVVTFVNIVPSAGQGFVQVCKAAGAGISNGTNFNFTVNGSPLVVAAGSCAAAIGVPAGSALIQEPTSAGSVLTGITALPNGFLIFTNLQAGIASVTVQSGVQTIVTFTNAVNTIASGEDVPFQLRYFANLDRGDSFIDIINTGANGAPIAGPGVGGPVGNICLNTYVFDPGEELIACCSCLITPNQVVNLGVKRDLLVNPTHPFTGNSVTVKLLNTIAGVGGSSTTCNQSAANANFGNIVPGMAAYGTTLHALVPLNLNTTFVTTETAFTPATLSPAELASLTNRCTSILANSSNFGVCSACRFGTLGGDKQ
jgi:hypothetical protein